MGYTGNFVCGVWFGNDDYTPTNRMTGGALPAMTWHSIMEYAHQGIEIKQLPGIPVPVRPQQKVASAKSKADETPPPRPTTLSKRGAEILVRVEHMLDDANRAMTPLRPTVSASENKRPDRLSSNELPGAALSGPQSGGALASALEGRAFGSSN
jgi:penicillin-binding protein 1A